MSERYRLPWWAQEARCQWVLLSPCGCAQGVMEGSEALDVTEAWSGFYDYPWLATEARKKGFRVIQVDHEYYVAKYSKQMELDWVCPHKTKLGFWRRVLNAIEGKGW